MVDSLKKEEYDQYMQEIAALTPKQQRKWKAAIRRGGEMQHLGLFAKEEDAAAAKSEETKRQNSWSRAPNRLVPRWPAGSSAQRGLLSHPFLGSALPHHCVNKQNEHA